MKRIALVLILSMNLSIIYGQGKTKSYTAYFTNLDGFRGYIKFDVQFEGFAGQLRYGNAILYLSTLDGLSNEESKVLQNNGIMVNRGAGQYHEIRKFGAEILVTPGISIYNNHQFESKVIRYSSAVNPDFTTFEGSEHYKNLAKEYRKNYNKSLWEEHGYLLLGNNYLKVTTLYLSDLKNEIDRILGEYRRANRAFDTHINKGTSYANGFDFDEAAHALAEAKVMSNDTGEQRSKINNLERLITSKKKEKEEADKKAKEEAEKEDNEEQNDKKEEQSEKSASSGGADKKTDSKKGKDSKKSDTKKESEAQTKSASEIRAEMYFKGRQEMAKGDDALSRGKYSQALTHYKKAQSYGVHVDQERLQKADVGVAVASTIQLLSYIPEEDETINGLTLSYYSIPEMWNTYSFSWNPTHYWGNFFVQWSYTFNYSKGKMWMQAKDGIDGIDYGRGTKTISKEEFNQRFGSGFQPSEDEVLFYKTGDSFVEYAYYENQDFEDYGGGMELGLGVSIPIGDGIFRIPAGIAGLGNLGTSNHSYGYRAWTGVEVGKLYFRTGYLGVGRKSTMFTQSVLQEYSGVSEGYNNKRSTLEPFEKIKENSRTAKMIQFSIGIYL